MISYYLKNTSSDGPCIQTDIILYAYISSVIFVNPLLRFFLLSKNEKVRLPEYLRHKLDFVVLYGKRAKTKIDRVINCNSIINQKHRKYITLKRRTVDNYNIITRHNIRITYCCVTH